MSPHVQHLIKLYLKLHQNQLLLVTDCIFQDYDWIPLGLKIEIP